VDVVIWTYWHQQEWNSPQSGQSEADKNDLSREPLLAKELAHG
jgi:hypothetical protein